MQPASRWRAMGVFHSSAEAVRRAPDTCGPCSITMRLPMFSTPDVAAYLANHRPVRLYGGAFSEVRADLQSTSSKP